jgi:hypothetical protein
VKIELESRQLDDKRRLIMPETCPPRSAVTIQELDQDTWLVKRHRAAKDIKVVLIPVLDKLPHDSAWDKVEEAFGRRAYSKLPRPES